MKFVISSTHNNNDTRSSSTAGGKSTCASVSKVSNENASSLSTAVRANITVLASTSAVVPSTTSNYPQQLQTTWKYFKLKRVVGKDCPRPQLVGKDCPRPQLETPKPILQQKRARCTSCPRAALRGKTCRLSCFGASIFVNDAALFMERNHDSQKI